MSGLSGPMNATGLRRHAGYARLFAPGALTIGLILPLESHPFSPSPTMRCHVEMARQAEAMGFGALWLRDIPFYDPHYGDVGQVFESLTYIAHLAAQTRSIALGTAGIVLPLREPLLLAKQVATVDRLSGGRMVLGVSSGDRASDFPLFGIEAQARGERLREVYDVYRTVTEQAFPHFTSRHFGRSDGQLDLIPKPPLGRTPALAIGRAQQELPWIATHMDGMISGVVPQAQLQRLAEDWAGLVGESPFFAFRPLGLGGFLDLVRDRNHAVVRIPGGIRAGVRALAEYLAEAERVGFVHFAMNLRVSERPYGELIEELAAYVLPRFPSHTAAEADVDVARSDGAGHSQAAEKGVAPLDYGK